MSEPNPARYPAATHLERTRFGTILERRGEILFSRSDLAVFLSRVPTA